MGIDRTIGVTIKLIAHPIRPGRMERTEKPLANLLEARLALLLSISSEVRLAHDAPNALVKVVDCSAFVSETDSDPSGARLLTRVWDKQPLVA